MTLRFDITFYVNATVKHLLTFRSCRETCWLYHFWFLNVFKYKLDLFFTLGALLYHTSHIFLQYYAALVDIVITIERFWQL